MADKGYENIINPKREMVESVCAMGAAMKAPGLELMFVYFIDGAERLQQLELEMLVHCTHWTQRRMLPLMFVISGPFDLRDRFYEMRSDGCFLFTGHKVFRGQTSSVTD